MLDAPGRGSRGGREAGSSGHPPCEFWGGPDARSWVGFSLPFAAETLRSAQAGMPGPGQAAPVLPGGRRRLLCKWILSVVMLKGGDACRLHGFLKRVSKAVAVAVVLEAEGRAGDAGSARCPGVTAGTPGPVPGRTGARRPAWEGCAAPAEGRGRGCSHPRHPHQVLLIRRLFCTSQASFNVACLSLFELLFGIKQNNQRFVMFPALNRITKLKKQLKYL